jgi:hypothetical protein
MINTSDNSTKSLNPLYLIKKSLIKEGKLKEAQLEMAKKP